MSDTTKVTAKITGVLKSAYNVEEKDENGSIKKCTNIVSLFQDGSSMETSNGMEFKDSDQVKEFFNDFYASTAKKWIPDWHKEEKDYMSFKSSFNIPCMIDPEKKQLSFAEFVERGNIRGAKVILKCNVKDNALYPSALLILEEGTPYDAFENF